MAPRKAAETSRTYDPDTLYDVSLARIVEWNGLVLSPGKQNQLKGKVCAEIDADIVEATPVQDRREPG